MKIAVTYENGSVFGHFGHTEQFKLYQTENGAVVQAFLKEHPEFEPAALPEMVQKACGIADKQAWKVILLPHKGQRAQTDGFFIATTKKVR